jgi:hypothetical protein
MVVMMIIAVLITESSAVPFTIAIPPVVMLNPATIAFPIAVIELLPVMTRPHPTRSFVRGKAPIALMPPIVALYGVPIAVDPYVAWTGAGGSHANFPRRRWRADSDSK